MKEIVIKIPDELYNTIVENSKLYTISYIKDAIAHGTPLPKGHGKIIEVTPKLEAILDTYQRYTGIDEAPYEYASEAIAKAEVLIEADKGDEE